MSFSSCYFVSVTIWPYIPEGQLKRDSVFNTKDSSPHTCHNVATPDLDKFPLMLVLPNTQKASASQVTIVMEGSNLYCEAFDQTCTGIATIFFARSFVENPNNPLCLPFCGAEVPCVKVSAPSTRDLCQFECLCPPGGCKEIVLVMGKGSLRSGKTTKICEIEVT